MGHIDDYDMLDKDLEGSIRYGRECFAAEQIATDERRDWVERIRATAETIWKENETGTHSCLLPKGNDGYL